MMINLQNRAVNGGQVLGSLEQGYRLSIPEIKTKKYCLAQVDNYMHLARPKFPYQPPLKICLEACVSNPEIKGTWGFGLWNDPFSLGFAAGGMSRLLPVLPNVAWFFYASEENYLSLRDTQPGAGFHVKSFCSPLLPSLLSVLAVPGLPFVFWLPAARLLRRLSRVIVKEDTKILAVPVDTWHTYNLVWEDAIVHFSVDEVEVFRTAVSPQGRMGLVIWIDNQYFRFDRLGKLGFGFLQTPAPEQLQVRNLMIEA
jgi:hypothetical protein